MIGSRPNRESLEPPLNCIWCVFTWIHFAVGRLDRHSPDSVVRKYYTQGWCQIMKSCNSFWIFHWTWKNWRLLLWHSFFLPLRIFLYFVHFPLSLWALFLVIGRPILLLHLLTVETVRVSIRSNVIQLHINRISLTAAEQNIPARWSQWSSLAGCVLQSIRISSLRYDGFAKSVLNNVIAY